MEMSQKHIPTFNSALTECDRPLVVAEAAGAYGQREGRYILVNAARSQLVVDRAGLLCG